MLLVSAFDDFLEKLQMAKETKLQGQPYVPGSPSTQSLCPPALQWIPKQFFRSAFGFEIYLFLHTL